MSELDFSAFSESDFEAKAWVNNALLPENSDPNTPADAHASNIVLKLQMFIEVVANELETTSRKVVEDMPRVIKNVEVVQEEVESLKERMAVVKHELEKVEKDTSESMSLLVKLDKLKHKIEDTSTALQEADNWTTLSENIDKAFEANDFKQIVSTLLGMQRSLMVLSDCTDYEARTARLSNLQDMFVTRICPELEEAYKSHNKESAKELVTMLKDAQRGSKGLDVYTKLHKKHILALWSELCGDEQAGLSDVMTTFYSHLIKIAQEEAQWCLDVFEDSDIVCQLLVSTLNERDPTLTDCIRRDLVLGNQLNRIAALYKQTADFVNNIPLWVPELTEAALRGFSPFQLSYETLQSQTFNEAKVNISDNLNLEDAITAIQSAVPSLLEAIQISLERCCEFTQLKALPNFINCVDTFLAQQVEKLENSLPRISILIKEAMKDNQELSMIPTVFGLIDACGEGMQGVKEFENTLKAKVLASNSAVSKRMSVYDFRDEDELAQAKFDETLRALKRGETALIVTSNRLKSFNDTVHKLAYDTVLHPICSQLVLEDVVNTQADGDDENSFSLSPLQYITKVGENLLNLPLELEPFFKDDTATETSVTGTSTTTSTMSAIALKATKLDFAPSDAQMSAVDSWLTSVAGGVMQKYVQLILEIKHLTSTGTTQLCADIGYLCNVLNALNISPLRELELLNQLLSVAPESYKESVKSMNAKPAMVKRVKDMRRIK
eukprot:m.14408 g.14408  ORF g.14408 m.14408 type:complete len:725 (+) comp5080_c0_seq1:240-2414(+)